MGSYVMLEGNLEDIDRYTLEQNSHYYDTSHCRELFSYREDHDVTEYCGMCNVGIGNYYITNDHLFEDLARQAQNRVEWANRPILVDGKEI